MKILKYIGLIFIGILLSYIGLNLFDDELDSNVQKIIDEKPPTLTQKELDHFIYYLGVESSEDKDPYTEGLKRFNSLKEEARYGEANYVSRVSGADRKTLLDLRLCRGDYCTDAEYEKSHDLIRKALLKQMVNIQRYDKLMSGGIPINPLPRKIETLSNGPITFMLKLGQLKIMQINDMVYKKNIKAAVLELEKMKKYSLDNIKDNTVTMLGALVHIAMLNKVRTYAIDKSKENDQFKSEVKSSEFLQKPMNIDYKKLVSKILNVEVQAMAGLFIGRDLVWEDFVLTSIVEKKRISIFPKFARSMSLKLLFKPNKTLNSLKMKYDLMVNAPCIYDDSVCKNSIAELKPSEYVTNVVGNKLIYIFQSHVFSRFEKMYEKILVLNQPLFN